MLAIRDEKFGTVNIWFDKMSLNCYKDTIYLTLNENIVGAYDYEKCKLKFNQIIDLGHDMKKTKVYLLVPKNI